MEEKVSFVSIRGRFQITRWQVDGFTMDGYGRLDLTPGITLSSGLNNTL